jgi:hypothetical protein
MMGYVDERVTVWAVRLGLDVDEVRGTLSIDDRHLSFTHEKGSRHIRIPLHAIRAVKRSWVSPVLIVEWVDGGELARTALYFARPPPLEDPAGGRRRKHRRQSAQYLMAEGAITRPKVKQWRAAILEAAKNARL